MWARVVTVAVVVLAGRPAAAERMVFHWPVPVKVVVTDKVSKNEGSATLRYQVAVTSQGPGKPLAVRLGDFEFLEVDGHDARDPALRKQLRGALQAASALPTILVSPEGTFLDVVDLETMIDRIARSTAMAPNDRRALVRVMKSPAMQASLKARSVEFWNVWVGLWAGAELDPGRRREVSVETSLPNGSVVARPVSISHLGPDGPPGYVHLSFESRLSAGAKDLQLRATVEGAARDLAASGGKTSTDEIEGFALYMAGDVVTDPETLRPAAARSQRRTTLKVKGQPPRTEVEAHVYTFAWPKTSAASPSTSSATSPAKTPR